MSPWIVKWIVDPVERAASTALEQIAAIIVPLGLVGGTLHVFVGTVWLNALDMAGFAFLLSLVTSYGTGFVPKLTTRWDFIWRLVKTYLQSFGGSMIASNVTSIVHFGWAYAATLAFTVTLGAAVKGGIAMSLPSTSGASLVPLSLTGTTGLTGPADVAELRQYLGLDPEKPAAPDLRGNYQPEHLLKN